MQETPYEREPGYALRYRERRFRTGSGPGTDRGERAALQRLLRRAQQPAGTWLDVPSGAGRLSGELPGAVVRADRDVAMLVACPGDAPRVAASAAALPFGDGQFAGVLCMRLLQHIQGADERRRILGELARVTRGPVLLSFFDRCSLAHCRRVVRRWLGRVSNRHAISRAQLRADLAAVGLRLVALAPLRRFLSEQTVALAVRG